MDSPQQSRTANGKADAGKNISAADNWQSHANDNKICMSSSSKEGDGDNFADDEGVSITCLALVWITCSCICGIMSCNVCSKEGDHLHTDGIQRGQNCELRRVL